MSYVSRNRPRPAAVGGARPWLGLAVALLLIAVVSRATAAGLAGAPEGRVETGIPSFAVFGADAIGLSAAPTSVHVLPDGRVLLTAQNEIAFGDGVRWEVFRAAEGEQPIFRDVAVGPDGTIYYGANGALCRLAFSPDGTWHAQRVVDLPTERQRNKTMLGVSTTAGDWYWHTGSGDLVQWRPGQPARVVPSRATIETVFQLGGALYVSDQSSGALFRLGDQSERVTSFANVSSELVTASVAFDEQHVLLGTYASGLELFDGTTRRPLGEAGRLATRTRINNLCAAGEGYFAAAVDTYGVIFFDRTGKLVEALDARVDHRLARPEKMCYSPDGVLWVLLSEGVARVEFPARITRFDAMIPSGLTYVSPFRYQGDLWMLADGRSVRGVYDGHGRLERFVPDLPPGRFTFTLTTVDDLLFACSDEGIYVRDGENWRPVATGIVNARVGIAKTPSGDIVYAARGEIGYLHRTNGQFTLHRVAIAGLQDNYSAVQDRAGVAWLELGSGKVGRLDPRGREPTLTLFGTEAGLPDGWIAIFELNGDVFFKPPHGFLCFDDKAGRFAPEANLSARYPQFVTSRSRPQLDPFGNVWYSDAGKLWTIDITRPNATPRVIDVPITVLDCKIEASGVAWLFGDRRIVRYDPSVRYDVPRPRTIVTAVTFPNSNRQMIATPALGTIPFEDNTLVFRFAGLGNPFASRLRFEVMMEGASDGWVRAGSTGQAVFNRLKEGAYTFRVRAVTSSGETSETASVTFAIAPPWYRTSVAWFAYFSLGAAMLAFSTWYPAVRQRREKVRLERLVAKRTEELHRTNQQLERQIDETTQKSSALAVSEERYRALSADLERRVTERTAELSASYEELSQRESLFRLIFEHAPVGISWKRVDLDNLHHFNQTYRRILDLSVETLPDFSALTKLLHPEDLPKQIALEQQITRGEIDSGRLELRFTLAEGRVVWTSSCVAVVRNPTGGIVQVIGIIEDITARKDAERKLAATYKELLDTSRMAGMAEVATGVLHNVGNVLNSLNVSANLLSNTVRASKVESLTKLSALLHERSADLGNFLTNDPKGRLVPELLNKLAANGIAERDWLVNEIGSMQKNIDHIKDIVAMQQSYATVLGVTETLEPAALFEDAIRMNAGALSRHDVRLVREYAAVPAVRVEKGKVLQILINVIRNAKYACDDGQTYGPREKVVTVRLESAEDRVRFIVSDNGIGIAPENLTKIFAHGFTTRSYGHGFGLHSSALAAREMKGSLRAESEGLGKGATFVLEIPAANEAAAVAEPSASPTSPALK